MSLVNHIVKILIIYYIIWFSWSPVISDETRLKIIYHPTPSHVLSVSVDVPAVTMTWSPPSLRGTSFTWRRCELASSGATPPPPPPPPPPTTTTTTTTTATATSWSQSDGDTVLLLCWRRIQSELFQNCFGYSSIPSAPPDESDWISIKVPFFYTNSPHRKKWTK